MYPDYLNPYKTSQIFGLDSFLDQLVVSYEKNKLPKVNLLTGEKGSGKFSLVLHFLNYVFLKSNYDLNNKQILNNLNFNDLLEKNIHQNILIINNEDTSTKINEIRELKKKLLKSSLNSLPRFIILDNVDNFNTNSSNALLKALEEPSINDYFFLINNKKEPLIETIKSRCIETKIFIKNNVKSDIIRNMLQKFNIVEFLNSNKSYITPGIFLKFNYLCEVNNININENLDTNVTKLILLFKKNKEKIFINLAIYLIEEHFKKISNKVNVNHLKLNSKKILTIQKINDLLQYNLNTNVIINSISSEINNV